MRKKFISVMLTAAMATGPAGCGNSGGTSTGAAVADTQATEVQKGEVKDDAKKEDEREDSEVSDNEGASDFHISIITGSAPQSGNGRCGAEAFQAMYGEDVVKLAVYPDNFTEELGIIVQIIVNLSDDSKMRAIIMNQSVPGTAEAFYKIKKTRPDILCIADEGHKDLPEIDSVADLAYNNDFVTHGYLTARTAHELGCDAFVHISSPHHMAYETMSRRVATMKEACKKFGAEFVPEIAPGLASNAGVASAQVCIPKKVPKWVEKYGKNAAYFCTNDAYTEPLLKQLMEYGGCFIEADLPSPLTGYPGALSIDLAAEAGDPDRVLTKVESTIAERDGVDHLRTWVYSYGYTISAGLIQHALSVFSGESELDDIGDIAEAYQMFSPKAEWNGSNYTSMETGVKLDNAFLVHRDTYIIGDPGHLMGPIKIEVLEKYFIIK